MFLSFPSVALIQLILCINRTFYLKSNFLFVHWLQGVCQVLLRLEIIKPKLHNVSGKVKCREDVSTVDKLADLTENRHRKTTYSASRAGRRPARRQTHQGKFLLLLLYRYFNSNGVLYHCILINLLKLKVAYGSDSIAPSWVSLNACAVSEKSCIMLKDGKITHLSVSMEMLMDWR